jgi:hypothetical protein
MLRVSDCVCNGIRPAIPQPPKRQLGDEINAAMVFARRTS